MSVNKRGPGAILGALACVLGIAGLITMVISSTMSSGNALYSLTLLVVLAVAGVVLAGLLFAGPQSWKGHAHLSLLSIVGAIALFTVVMGNVISSRVMLVAGLFSYNSGNTAGWSVFYVTVASVICFLVAIVALIVGAFTKPSK